MRKFYENLKKNDPSQVTSLRSKDENLALAQENWTKLAIKLSAKVLLYLIP